MAITAGSVNASISATETVALDLDCSDDPTVQEEKVISVTLNPGSSPAATQQWCDMRILAAGTDTIDLTALNKGNLTDLDLTGLKVRAIIIEANSGNTAVINVSPGVSNGYDLFGASNNFDVKPGGFACFYFKDAAPIVAVADAELDITSAHATAGYTVQLLAG